MLVSIFHHINMELLIYANFRFFNYFMELIIMNEYYDFWASGPTQFNQFDHIYIL